MKFNYDESEYITDVYGTSFLKLDNIYEKLHEYYTLGKSGYVKYLGMYFLSKDAKNLESRNNMYLKAFGMSRTAYIGVRVEQIRESLMNLGELTIKGDLSSWMLYVDEYIDSIWDHPYTEPYAFLEIYMHSLTSCKMEDAYSMITNMYNNGDAILLKGLRLLLENHPLSNFIGELFSTERN